MAKKPVLEMAIMNVLWDSPNWLSPSQVRDRLSDDRRGAYTTVTTVLVRLCKKNRVERIRQGKAFAYRATQTRDEYTAQRMEEVLHAGGDRSGALSRYVDNLSASERRDLQQILDQE